MARRDDALTESQIIALIARLKSSAKNLVPGDDIARFKSGGISYAGSDSLIENIHYKHNWLSAGDIAWKLFARNWSDFMCKGIAPAQALLNLNLKPSSADRSFVVPFLRTLDILLLKHGITLVGGDTARSPHDSFTLTLIGHRGKFIPRRGSGIRPGDVVLQFGAVGGSEYARELLAKKTRAPAKVLNFFRRPRIFPALPAAPRLKAALDQSDSVAKTLQLLAEANHALIHVELESIALAHPAITGPREILSAAEDLAVFGIAAKSSPAFRAIGHIDSIRVKRPGVVYRHRSQPFELTADGGKIVSYADPGFEHF